MPLPAIILAAGSGKRIGKGPKALLTTNGTTFLERVIGTTRAAGCMPVIAVVPPGVPELETLARSQADRTVVNPHPERGMFASARLGIEAALEAAEASAALLLFPVDHPDVQPSTLTALMKNAAGPESPVWVRPTFQGRGGHPVLLGADIARELLALDSGTPLRDALRSLGHEPVDLSVEDPGILRNINTDKDLS